MEVRVLSAALFFPPHIAVDVSLGWVTNVTRPRGSAMNKTFLFLQIANLSQFKESVTVPHPVDKTKPVVVIPAPKGIKTNGEILRFEGWVTEEEAAEIRRKVDENPDFHRSTITRWRKSKWIRGITIYNMHLVCEEDVRTVENKPRGNPAVLADARKKRRKKRDL